MRLLYVAWCVVIGGLAGFGVSIAKGDPCGMVPPIDWAAQTPIKRIGVQMTYVFYQRGVETIVLRPGFSGKVDEFGMLIPFPAPPAIRKVPDNVFEQIAAAIDPPEVVIDLSWRESMYGGGGFGGGGFGGFGGGLGFQVPKDEVRVIRKEAVGMYEVAVLAAGSAAALKRWMDDHKFAYPSGMDAVCPQYVDQGWCFVAVKTKVNQKQAAEPQPGQRAIDNALPNGASFDGHVQAMGFRFHTRELVVPMRLSVHNSGELRNVVYLLSDNPSKIRNIPEEFVRRQVSGFKLFDQMTKPLPLRIIGGTIADVPRATRIRLAAQRDPEPHNGVAAELFASDLVAARTGQLESRDEAYEKHLLAINEALQLRGPEIDAAVREQSRGERARLVRAALTSIDKMTLTVIDGDFPREVLARENLTFAEYHMPLERSDRSFYDANKLGRSEPVGGVLYVDAAAPSDETQIARIDLGANKETRQSWLLLVFGIAITAGLAAFRLPARYRTPVVGGSALLIVLTSLLAVGKCDEKIPALNVLMNRLGNPDTAEQAAEQIVLLGERAVPALIVQSREADLIKRGWAIVCLGRIGSEDAVRHLKALHEAESIPPLVQTWAAAAMIEAAASRRELEALLELANDRPELTRPLMLAFRKQFDGQEDESERLLVMASRSPAVAKSLGPALMAAGTEPLVRAMLQSEEQTVRRTAAGYVASFGQRLDSSRSVAADIVAALKFDPSAERAPWHGGPLFIPNIPWQMEEAQALVGNLIRWHLWAERHEINDVRRQINNNLQSVTLANAAGYQITSSVDTKVWLQVWQQVVGVEELQRILVEQQAEVDYAELLKD